MTTYTILHLFSGLGGAAMGFQQSASVHKGVQGRFRTLAGIDVDPAGCRDFEQLTGSPAACMDLFSREDYKAFHGKEPPATWREATPADLRAATGGECPDVVFLSPPCKGFSGLLPKKAAASEKYQALNRLTVRGLWYTLEAYADDLPGVILLENVPRITTRGKDLLRQVCGMLKAYGYVYHLSSHDCGEMGGLGQRRKRFLLIARLPSKVPALIYQPTKKPLRTIGDVIGPMPLPDAPECGAMHRLPRLKWNTWVRLALIPAGGDWRDLQKIEPEDYRLTYEPRGGGTYGVQRWDDPAATVTGSASVKGSNAVAVSDKRARAGHPSMTVTGSKGVNYNNGCSAISDPRLTPASPKFNHAYAVAPFDQPSPTVAGGTSPSSGGVCVADPRIPEADERPDPPPVIIALDGTWHRPLTTLELAALQGFPLTMPDGSPLALDGKNDGKWRERIGNAVPPPAAKAMGEQILQALMAGKEAGFTLSASSIWVAPKVEELPV